MNLNKLFNPQSIAIVGASEEQGKVGNVIAKNISDPGYQGDVFFVNPKHETLFGRKCYKSLNEIDGQVDLAIIAIPAKLVVETIKEAEQKVKNYVVISAGFGETDVEGREREKELKQVAEKYNLSILGPNCLGFIAPALKLNASFAGQGLPGQGNIAFVSQSGALAVALLDMAEKRNLKFSLVASIGNKMQLSETELLKHLNADEKTKVIGMYLEGIKDGKKFIEAATKTIKPIVIVKAGKTAKAQKAISSHTGALAGSDEVMDAAFEKAGILRAENLEEFVDILHLISLSDAPGNPAVAIVTNAGGAGVLTTDAFLNRAVMPAEISADGKNRLREFLPKEASV
jgi:acetyltransferase